MQMFPHELNSSAIGQISKKLTFLEMCSFSRNLFTSFSWFLFFLILEVDFAPANWIQLFIKSGRKRTFARRTTKIKLLICFSYHNGLRLSTSTGCLNFNTILINYQLFEKSIVLNLWWYFNMKYIYLLISYAF